jgi:hypothetical protein
LQRKTTDLNSYALLPARSPAFQTAAEREVIFARALAGIIHEQTVLTQWPAQSEPRT